MPSGAAQSTPVCILVIAEQRVMRTPKPDRMMPVGDGLAHQELLRALAGLVVVVDDAVVGGLKAIDTS